MAVNFNVNSYSEPVKNKNNNKREALAICAGISANSLLEVMSLPVGVNLMKKLQNVTEIGDAPALRTAINQSLEKSGALKNGVKFVDFAIDSKFKKEIATLFENMPAYYKKISEFTNLAYQAYKGKNAAFMPLQNQILVDTNKMGCAAFHEIGHSINFNNSKFWKIMQLGGVKLRPLAGLIALIAISKRPKKEGEQPKGLFDKTTTFIKNNVGKLTALVMLPGFAEEMMATYRGNKLAKEFLSPELFKKVIKSNKLGGASYALQLFVVPIAAWVSSKVADKVREKLSQ